MAEVARFTSPWIALLWTVVVLLLPAPVGAQGTAPPSQGPPPALTFHAAVDLAVAYNLDLAAVRRARAIRQANLRAAGQWANPEFAADITRDSPHGDLAIGLPLDIGGVRSRRVAMAKEELAMADVQDAIAVRDLRRKVRLAFYGLLSAHEQAALAEDVLHVAQRVREVAQARFEEGAAPRLEVMQADLGIVRLRTDLELARSARRAAQADLNALLNRPPGSGLTLAGRAGDMPPLPTLDRAMTVALASNVDLRAAAREAVIEDRYLAVLKAERVPTPTISFGTALNAPGEFDVGPHAGVSLAIPLFSRKQGEIAGSLARSDTMNAQREAIRRQVEATVFAALERVTAQRALVEAFRTTLLPSATELQDLAEESYRLGRDSILVALDAQRSLRDVKYEYLKAQVGLQSAVADLEDVLGGPLP